MRSASRANTSSVVAPSMRRRRRAGAAVLARAVDLDDRLRRLEAARRGDLLDQRLDVGAEELRRAMAGVADRDESAADGGTTARSASALRRNRPCARARPRPSTAACDRRWRGRCRDLRGGRDRRDRRRSDVLSDAGKCRGCGRVCWSACPRRGESESRLRIGSGGQLQGSISVTRRASRR